MKTGYISVPFKAESSNGLSEYTGIAKFSPAGIIFEFESKLFGLIGGEYQEVRVTLDEITGIRFRKGIFRFFATIRLRLKHFAKISALPHDGGKIKLKIKREDFELAREAVEQTLQYINRERADLPPAKTSVDELFETEKLDTNKLDQAKSENKELKD